MLKLSSKTAQLLSSGQVISSPCNAVKELVENSLDAEASSIEVKLEKGGLGKIEVRDNGKGINATEMELAAQRHYTSKIRSHSDLETLITYGFRGEALSSLCEISDVTITTRTKSESYSNVYDLDFNGKVKSKKPSHISQGTTVTALNLFKNIPVRKQFYSSAKKLKEQLKQIEDILMAFAISQPSTQFKLLNDRCIIWQKPSESNEKRVFLSVLGSPSIQLHYIEKKCSVNNVNIKVYFPTTFVKRKTKDRFFLIINKRPVHHKQIEKLARSHILNITDQDNTQQTGGWPAALVVIDVLPSAIDVNVNPNKTEVYLTANSVILDLLEEMFKSFCIQPGRNAGNKDEIITQNENQTAIIGLQTDNSYLLKPSPSSSNNNVDDEILESNIDSQLKISFSNSENNSVDASLENEVLHFSNCDTSSKSSLENEESNVESNTKSPLEKEKENVFPQSNTMSSKTGISKKCFVISELSHAASSTSHTNSNSVGSLSWSRGTAVDDGRGSNVQPVHIAHRFKTSSKRESNEMLKQSTLDTAVSFQAAKKPRTVAEVSQDSTDKQWIELNADEQEEMIEVACLEYDAFSKKQNKCDKEKKKTRKSFMTVCNSDDDDEVFEEPDKVIHKFNFKKFSDRIVSSYQAINNDNTKVPCIVGFINNENVAVLKYSSTFFLLNLQRLQEILVLKKLVKTMKLPCIGLEQTILIDKESLGCDLYFCLQTMALSATTQLQPDAEVIDKRITYNGFKIKRIQNSSTEFHIFALANFVSSYGLKDLIEVLEKIHCDKDTTIEKSRPSKCIYYLQSEASRMTRSNPVLRSKLEILDALSFLKTSDSTWINFLSELSCYHCKKVFQAL